MSSLACAVIAAGSQGRVHAQGYSAMAGAFGVALTAVADPDLAAASELAGDLGIPGVYDSHEKLLQAERPDVVSICTPPASHLEIAAAAIGDVVSVEGYCPTGRPPVSRSEHAVAGAEIIFATYESSRSRRRVTLPLHPQDNALLSGLEQGFWHPAGEQHSTY